MPEVIFEKQCDCIGTSTTNQIRTKTVWDDDPKKGVHLVTRFIPGPSCDECGKEWTVKTDSRIWDEGRRNDE